jgi:tRNA threonylcarbamoyladenosine modification (KEOPS) complex  Pcc1 subunit
MECTLHTGEEYGQLRELFAAELGRAHDRSQITLTEQEGKAVFHVTAKDVTALRAALNTITSMLSIHMKTKEIIHG